MIEKPSPAQKSALKRMYEAGGEIHRLTGGFWVSGSQLIGFAGGPLLGEGQTCSDVWCDIRTVRALEKNGWAVRTNYYSEEWRDSRVITDAGRAVAVA